MTPRTAIAEFVNGLADGASEALDVVCYAVGIDDDPRCGACNRTPCACGCPTCGRGSCDGGCEE